MDNFENKAKSCFHSLFEKRENDEHMAIGLAQGHRNFGYFFKPKIEDLDESIQYLKGRIDSLDKSDKLFFIDALLILLNPVIEKSVNSYTRAQIGDEKIKRWEKINKGIFDWVELQRGNKKLKKLVPRNKKTFNVFSDLFHFRNNAEVILSLLKRMNPPIIKEGIFHPKQKGSIVALKEAITNISFNGQKINLLHKEVNDSIFAEVIIKAIPGLEITDRTLRNPGSKEYKIYLTLFRNEILKLINKEEIKI